MRVETLIIGAGVIGSSVAMHLARLGLKDIRVVDVDLEGSLSSSELNAGGVRATWVQPINIAMSKLSIEYFGSLADEVGYRPCGYLWLHSAEKLPAALRARETQQAMGWEVQSWDVAELRRKIPFIDKTADLAGAIFAPRDGLVNPNLIKNKYRAEARKLGVRFDDRTRIRQAEYARDGSTRVTLTAECWDIQFSPAAKLEVLTQPIARPGFIAETSSRQVIYEAKTVVNCAGPWAPQIAQVLGYPCPSFPVRRQICLFDCRDVDLTPYGMIVDRSGVYFHPEATNALAGFATPGEPHGVNYTYDGEAFFIEQIWPALYERATAFEKLKHLTGWAGIYEVSPDECAIIGRVEAGEARKSGSVFEAHSFSGHGVMHSYGAGLALAEIITRGRGETFDVGQLSGKRFESGKLLHEKLVI